jgi:sec-independent protein translocase protein TatB
MFDLSWIELTFCLALALIVVGPKDLPRLVKFVSNGVRKLRRMSADVMHSVGRLEREISLAEEGGPPRASWQELIPQEIREMRASIEPHGADKDDTARRYRLYKEAAARARAEHASRQESATAPRDIE